MIGTIVSGKYRVDSLIGSGGMANVYKAFDLEKNHVIALKVLKDEHKDDAEFLRRFDCEAKAVLTLSHENIVSSYDVGTDGDIHYIVLEYVYGSTLKELIKEGGSLPPKTAVNIACQVLEALNHAHECGIIHRDVKPQNVIITPRGKAKLTDFGIARDAGATTRTFVGASVIGTVHYISPEQARGDSVTAESDIYSCAIMLYEMLTGSVPFGGDNSVAIALKHLQEDIKPPIEVNSKIPRALSDVIVKAASKDPSMRYHTANQMRADLLRAIREPNGKFARIVASKTADRQDTGGKKRPHLGIVNIALMMIIVIGLFMALFFIWRSANYGTESRETELVVPTLQGKLFSAAEEVARLRGFNLEISGYEESNVYPEGQIVTQTPEAGLSGKAGDTITVVLSSGNGYETVPKLCGGTVEEAELILDQSSLILGERIYDSTSELPEGQIIRQEPEEGAQVFEGDPIDVWISGTPAQNIEMPAVVEHRIAETLEVLKAMGFTRIWITPVRPETEMEDGTVLKQTPAAGMSVSKTALVELTVSDAVHGDYAADMAFNVDIAEDGGNVVITAIMADGTETVLYTTTLNAGTQQAVSCTGYLESTGSYECVVYVNGTEVKRNTVKFEFRSKG